MKNKKEILVIAVLLFSVAVSFGIPKPKYESLNILSKIDVPWRTNYWISQDVSNKFDTRDQRYNFIGNIFGRAYVNRLGERLLFLILDAGNFHNPKVCFGGSGYKISDFADTQLKVGNKVFVAKTLYVQKESENTLLVYWICIDKKIVNWGGQKILEFWNTLLNKKKAGLMLRLEIPTTEGNIPNAQRLANEFLNEIASNIKPDQAEYLFGK
ncbi:MAG: EpsI family protein [Candidatus Omnitrophica bacterium]|nr:EpsI family protein [Candidatus Omnitrophota bacterium]